MMPLNSNLLDFCKGVSASVSPVNLCELQTFFCIVQVILENILPSRRVEASRRDEATEL